MKPHEEMAICWRPSFTSFIDDDATISDRFGFRVLLYNFDNGIRKKAL